MNDLTRKRAMSVAGVVGLAAATTLGVLWLTNKTPVGGITKKVTG